ncbi:hypothetical protein P171DRAFT_478875 [Karstenula rhodostoma CBS 690.94]|uniref:Small ribosomal subunit protein mS38 n=1 Tax=Karstenula rhodostoma CBS 690.94 TaxID=1392251 RepID=A0A9P4UIL3_9PLEO|nr:hypothetical protein P171DRAFT_478875 [Karstenula rhodostoma CBS 690.94]
MFSSAAGRVIRSSSTLPPPSVCAFARPAALGATQKPFPRPGHQRRLSSSKASTPPDSSNGSSSAPQAPASAEKNPLKKATENDEKMTESGKKQIGRRKKQTTTSAAPTLNVPHVLPTNDVEVSEVKLSSFFSLHRPISMDTFIPPVASTSSFDAIFAPRSPYNKKTTVGNIQVLNRGIQNLEAAMAIHETHAASEEASQVELQRLDGQSYMTLDELTRRLVPFRPPPPPLPVGEATDIYSATSAPLFEIEMPAAENEPEQYEVRQPFLDRMIHRQNRNNRSRDILQRPDMLAISVKRQRKLKMKKHKYKKLMKRTRLLRRKLDRT